MEQRLVTHFNQAGDDGVAGTFEPLRSILRGLDGRSLADGTGISPFAITTAWSSFFAAAPVPSMTRTRLRTKTGVLTVNDAVTSLTSGFGPAQSHRTGNTRLTEQ